jgi:SH3-like domain-containing protein
MGLNWGLQSVAVVIATTLLLFSGPSARAQAQRPPYWASITQVPAIMRRGPSREMPAQWQYVRDDLPVKVIAVYQDWRRVEDPGGTVGWMHVRLLSAARTAIITGDTHPLRASPDAGAPVVFQAEAGVVGRISDCTRDWCMFDVRGRAGWVEVAHIWGGGAP